jgi:signal transduction histidine kinase
VNRLHAWLLAAPARRALVDACIALFALVVMVATTVAGPAQERGHLGWRATVIAIVTCAVLAFRRRWPYLVLLVAIAGAEAYLMMIRAEAGVLGLTPPLIALYTVAEIGGRRRSLALAGLGVLALSAVHSVIRPSMWIGPENIALVALGALAVAAGDAAWNRRAYATQAEERARQAERNRMADAARRVTEERLRIARDLHDAVGHHLALINVQSGVADQVLDRDQAEARRALAQIRRSSRAALRDLRDTIGLLRQPGDAAAPVQPAVGLDGLDELIASFAQTGLRLDRRVHGPVRPVSSAAGLVAYRVVQESLTNVRKHAGESAATVSLTYRPQALCVVIEDDGPAAEPGPPAGRPAGHGITGMAERVAAAGGWLTAGPRPGGGFRVSAELPLAAAP